MRLKPVPRHAAPAENPLKALDSRGTAPPPNPDSPGPRLPQSPTASCPGFPHPQLPRTPDMQQEFSWEALGKEARAQSQSTGRDEPKSRPGARTSLPGVVLDDVGDEVPALVRVERLRTQMLVHHAVTVYVVGLLQIEVAGNALQVNHR